MSGKTGSTRQKTGFLGGQFGFGCATKALWSETNMNRDVSTGPLARPFARLLAPLTRSLAPDCSLRSRPPLRSLVRSLAHFAHSLARGKVNFGCLKMTWFCPIVRSLPTHPRLPIDPFPSKHPTLNLLPGGDGCGAVRLFLCQAGLQFFRLGENLRRQTHFHGERSFCFVTFVYFFGTVS